MNYNISFPIAYALEKTGLPLILVDIQGHKVCLLLDTGSNKNLLNQKVYEYFKQHVEPSGQQEVFGLDGSAQKSHCVRLRFVFEGQEYSADFIVVDTERAFDQIQTESGIQIHGILGNEFFCLNKWIIDFDQCRVYAVD